MTAANSLHDITRSTTITATPSAAPENAVSSSSPPRHQYDNRAGRRRPAHRLFHRASTNAEQHVADDGAIFDALMHDDAAQLRGPRYWAEPQAHPIASQHIDQPV